MARVKEFDEIEALDKAVEIFWQKGYNATSANDLVKGLALSRSSIYSTFTNKRTLFIKALERYSEQNIAKVLDEIKQSEDIPKTLKSVFRNLIKQDDSAKIQKGCFMVNTGIELAPHDEEIAKIVNQNKQNVESILKIAIEKGQSLGQISKAHNPTTISRFIFNNISGLRVAVKSNKSKKELEEVVELCLSVLK